MAELPEEVSRFIDRYIDSVEALEVLLLLQREPAQEWTGGGVASTLHIGSIAADNHLAKLCSYNLLDVRVGNDLYYWFNPRPPHVARAARALGDAYAEQRLSILKLVLQRPAGPVRDFARAFRLTKDDSDG